MPTSRAEPTSTRIGVFFYLVSVGIFGAATLCASLGIGFYLLVHPANEIVTDRFVGYDTGPGHDKLAAFALLPQPAAPVVSTPAAPPLTTAPGARADLAAEASEENASDLQPEPSFSAGTSTQREGIQNFPPDANTAPVVGAQVKDGSAARPEGPEKHSSEPASQTTGTRGTVTDVPNVATWVVDGRTVRLFGIEPGPPMLLASLVNWVRAKGPIECLPQARTVRYRCFTGTGEDIAEAALLAGIGRTDLEAGDAYRDAEMYARRMGKGLWARR